MEFLVLHEKEWTVVAASASDAHGASVCFLLEQLSAFYAGNYKANVSGLIQLIERAAHRGPYSWSPVLMHEVDKKNKIYEFIKGSLRLFFFVADSETIVICTSVAVKKKNKVDKSVVAHAIGIKEKYHNAKSTNQLSLRRGKTDALQNFRKPS